MSDIRKKIEDILEFKPKKYVPKDLWGSIKATWTGLWTDFYGEWDELQASDAFPISHLLSGDAEKRLIQGIEALIKQEKKLSKLRKIK